jgi:4-amino-4-deoxy-L-arabinose transferase-like glycosyltransferase
MPLFSEGMFMDGLLYSAISNNMANGIGSFWQPYLSNSLFPEFYEHPPLAIGLQSLWFWLFGNSFLVERFYSLFTYLLTGIGLVSIWTQLGKSIKTGWIPLFFWLMVSNIIWAVSNNMLENTMAVFVIFATWSYLKGIQKKSFLFIILTGALLSLGFLSKGFVCLYIWAFPLGIFLFTKKISVTKTIVHTLIIVASTILPIILLYLFSEGAKNNLVSYFNKQVVGSIQNVSTVNSRFAIIGEFIQHIIIPISIAVIILIISKIKKQKLSIIKEDKKLIYLVLFILFCGIIPIMISMKQRGFYILTVYPFFGIIMGLVFTPLVKNWLGIIETKASAKKYLGGILLLLMISSITLSITSTRKIGRDKVELEDCKKVIEYIGTDKIIDICSATQWNNWSKHGYYARYGNITLDRRGENEQEFFIVNNNECDIDTTVYSQIDINLSNHTLYQRK